jgi:hypothetical protein
MDRFSSYYDHYDWEDKDTKRWKRLRRHQQLQLPSWQTWMQQRQADKEAKKQLEQSRRFEEAIGGSHQPFLPAELNPTPRFSHRDSQRQQRQQQQGRAGRYGPHPITSAAAAAEGQVDSDDYDAMSDMSCDSAYGQASGGARNRWGLGGGEDLDYDFGDVWCNLGPLGSEAAAAAAAAAAAGTSEPHKELEDIWDIEEFEREYAARSAAGAGIEAYGPLGAPPAAAAAAGAPAEEDYWEEGLQALSMPVSSGAHDVPAAAAAAARFDAAQQVAAGGLRDGVHSWYAAAAAQAAAAGHGSAAEAADSTATPRVQMDPVTVLPDAGSGEGLDTFMSFDEEPCNLPGVVPHVSAVSSNGSCAGATPQQPHTSSISMSSSFGLDSSSGSRQAGHPQVEAAAAGVWAGRPRRSAVPIAVQPADDSESDSDSDSRFNGLD